MNTAGIEVLSDVTEKSIDMTKNDLQQNWDATWHGLGLRSPNPSVFGDVLARYSEPHRYYHTLQHLSECFEHRQFLEVSAEYPSEVNLAIWFHDLVYDVYAKDNEARSAEFASLVMADNGATSTQISRVSNHILATSAHHTDQKGDTKFLLDIDLAILGASSERFSQYQEQIRCEYSYVPALIYQYKRREILKSFLERDSIYLTRHFQVMYEDAARKNLLAALSS